MRGKQEEEIFAQSPDVASDLLWGINSVYEALQQRQAITEVLIQQGKTGGRLQQIIELAKNAGVPVRFVDQRRLGVPSTIRHQGVVARHSAAPLLSLDDLLTLLPQSSTGKHPRLLVLDSIQDPRNLGSILRSALASGFGHVILPRERSAPVTGTVVRTSAGATAHLHICQVVNLADTLNRLKEWGFWIFGSVVEAEAQSIYTADFSGPVCLVIGSEEKGIRPLVKKQCDQLVTIPMQTSFNSLNASVAAAIIMFEIARRSSR